MSSIFVYLQRLHPYSRVPQKTCTVNCYIVDHAHQSVLKKRRTIYDGLSDEVMESYFRIPFYTVREAKMQSFQYKITHRIINCNKKWHEMKSNYHPYVVIMVLLMTLPIFSSCAQSYYFFWKDFFKWWNNFNHIHRQSFDLSGTKEILSLFGIQPLSDQAMGLNFCVLYAKYFIYKQTISWQ